MTLIKTSVKELSEKMDELESKTGRITSIEKKLDALMEKMGAKPINNFV